MRLTLECKSSLVLFLCSGGAHKEDIAALARKYNELNWIAIDGPYPYDHFHQDFETTYSSLAYTSERDVSQKRNLGLQIARLMNWEAVFFLDDDIAITPAYIYKAMDLLYNGNASVAGFSARNFPDNSVVVQADLLTTRQIDTFIGTGALAVRVDTDILSFFPHIYNEDWLFLLIHCLFSEGNVVWAGTIKQQAYDPFRSSKRAISEEPGDMLGESLMRLAMSISGSVQRKHSFEAITTALIRRADEKFWENEINTRLAYIRTAEEKIHRKPFIRHKKRVLRALKAARERLIGRDGRGGIQAKELAEWVSAWVRDLHRLNITKPVANLPTDLIGVMDTLGFAERCMYSCDASLLMSLSGVPEVETNLKQITKIKVEASYFDYGSTTLRPKIKQGLENTEVIQEYLASQGVTMTHIADSTSRLRFDRPIVDSLVSKPTATIAMFVAHGELLEHVAMSIQAIIEDNKNNSPLQLAIWVYGHKDKTYHELDAYRNELAARLVCEAVGTNLRIRSSVVTDKDSNIDQVISRSLSELALSYWKCDIPTDHHVLVVNSRNEILRYGTFWQFMRDEHIIPQQPLSTFLRTLPRKIGQQIKNPITKEDDEAALAKARAHLIKTIRPAKANLWPRQTPTARLVRHMKRRRLTWLTVDELAYKVLFHDKKGESLLASSAGVVCVFVTYRKTLPSDIYLIASEVNQLLKSYRKGRWGCMLVIRTDQKAAKKELVSYRKKLIRYITAQYEYNNITFLSFFDSLGQEEEGGRWRERLLTVAEYTYWLYNQDCTPKIVWRSIKF